MKTIIKLLLLFVLVMPNIVVAKDAEDWSRIYAASFPAVSPDGSFFVFEWCGSLWRSSVDGGKATLLGDGRTRDFQPIMSPDGKRIAFLSTRSGGWKLFEMALEETEGLKAGEVRQVGFHSEGYMPYAYTQDGKSILCVIDRDHAGDAKATFHGFARPALVSVDKRGAEQLIFDAPALDLSLSPDGKKLLFVSRTGRRNPVFRKRSNSVSSCVGKIWLYEIASKKFIKIIDRTEDCRMPIWTPDGKGFYFMYAKGGVRNVFHYAFKDGKEKQITDFKDDHTFVPSLSKDGKTMIVRNGFDFWRFNPDSFFASTPKRIVMHPANYTPSIQNIKKRWYSNAWNNDGGGYMTFTSEGNEIAFTAGGDLWVMDSTFRQPVRVHGSSRTHERACDFSPDGSTLYYLSDRGDGVDVWKAQRADPKRAWWENTEFICTRLTNDDVCRRMLSVSPDGTRLAWMNRTGKLHFADTNAVVQVVAKVASTDAYSYVWSPDSRWVAAAIRDGYVNSDIWILPTFEKDWDGKDAPAPFNLSRHHMWDCSPAWSSDGKVIAFCGKRAQSNDVFSLFYVYLNPEDEAKENPAEDKIVDARKKTPVKVEPVKKPEQQKTPAVEQNKDQKVVADCATKASETKTEKEAIKNNEPKEPKLKIVFDGLYERVRMTSVRTADIYFGYDPRKIALTAKEGVFTVTIPKDLALKKISSKPGTIAGWIKTKEGEKMLRIIDMKPAHGDNVLDFKVYQETNIADYQELAFLSAWAELRDGFCDPKLHGANWPLIREKYRLPARHASSWYTFNRVMKLMIGELDASHLGFYETDNSRKEWNTHPPIHNWEDFTAHIGARFDPQWNGEGWRVKDVVQGSPVDRAQKGLLPGDIVTAIDGKKVTCDMAYSDVMNVVLPHTFRVEYKRGDKAGVVFAEAKRFPDIRKLMRETEEKEFRKYVRSKGNYGYIHIKAMKATNLDDFMDEVFAEGYGKDGLVIDVRYNLGGSVADKILDVLTRPIHARTFVRGDAGEGYLLSYWGKPLLSNLPIVVLCNSESFSNGEIFSHAIKTLKRGKLVGITTAGEVIATNDGPLLDLGNFRRATMGFFTADGRDMEYFGAKPDIEVDITPEDIALGRDPQLDAALEALADEVKAKSASKPAPLEYKY